MAVGKFVSYLRVSTDKQGRSGLGLEAQRKAVEDFLNGGRWKLAAEYVEIETGKRADRPELRKALDHARATGAKLVIAKLDRLARNMAFTANLMESGVDFVAADNPHANRLTIHILAAVAEDETRRISERTKAALAAARARGTRLGSPNGAQTLRRYTAKHGNARGVEGIKAAAHQRATEKAAIIASIRAAGITSVRAIAGELNRRGILTARGGRWHSTTVHNLLRRLASASEATSRLNYQRDRH